MTSYPDTSNPRQRNKASNNNNNNNTPSAISSSSSSSSKQPTTLYQSTLDQFTKTRPASSDLSPSTTSKNSNKRPQPSSSSSSSIPVPDNKKQKTISTTTTMTTKQSNSSSSSARPFSASSTMNTSSSTAFSGKRSTGILMNGIGAGGSGLGNNQQPKKLVIKGFKVKPKLPENFESETWEKLRQAVRAVHECLPVPDSLEELYKMCENLCHHKMAQRLYTKLQAEFESHILQIRSTIIQYLQENASSTTSSGLFMGSTDSNDQFLNIIQDNWNTHCRQMIMIRSIFLYLDRTHVLQTPGLQSLWDLGQSLFRKHIIDHPDIRKKLVQGLIQLITNERNGNTIPVPLVKNLVKMLLDLGVYWSALEKPLVETTERYYEEEASRFVAEHLGGGGSGSGSGIGDIAVPSTSAVGSAVGNAEEQGYASRDVAMYLENVEKRLRQESERCQSIMVGLDSSTTSTSTSSHTSTLNLRKPSSILPTTTTSAGYLDSGTKKLLISVVERVCIDRYASLLLDRGFNDLMDRDALPDLERLFHMLKRVNKHDTVRKYFSEYIRTKGLELVMNTDRDPTMVQDLLAFKLKLNTILSSAFHSTEAFVNTLKESFESFINKRTNKPAELVAKYIDSLLKQGKLSELEVDTQLDHCLALFRFIQGKDIFEAFYKKDLAKRLLLQRSASLDAEKSMLIKLRNECGAGFTSKLENMFKDIEISRDIMQAFKESERFRRDLPHNIDMTVNVLTSGMWPTYPLLQVHLPAELVTCQDVFCNFYLSKHSGRRLQWQPSLGQCVLKARFGLTSGKKKVEKELSLSLFQALVLLLFNDAETLTAQEIQDRTGLSGAELTRTLISLSIAKVRLLTKSPKTKEFLPTDTFTINDGFDNPLYRIKISGVQMKETNEEQKDTEEKVMQDRQYQVDACIVRIMKTRKSLSHTLLISEVLGQMKFPMRSSDLKRRIESLLERDYLERDKKDSSVYNYVA